MGTPIRILIVEDSPDDYELILRRLRISGYEPIHKRVDTAQTLRLALNEGPWDVILTDYTMPQCSWHEAYEIISQDGKDIPFIVVSGMIGEETAVGTLKGGAHDYIPKGNLSRLGPAIERELREAENRREKRRMEENLRRSEERFRLILNGVKDFAIIMLDAEGRILSWNSGAERIRGYRAEEIIGKHFSIFYPPDDIERKDPERHLLMAVAEGRCEDEGWRIRKGGNRFWADVVTTPLYDDDGGLRGFAHIVRDQTERKKADEQLRQTSKRMRELAGHLQSIREEERSTIAREIHDQLGQELSAIKFDLAWIAKRLGKKEPEIREKAEAAMQMVDETIGNVQRISTQLRPRILDDVGLVAAIEWQANEFEARTGIGVELNIFIAGMEFGKDLSTAVFRIFQEILTNVARHSHASFASVDLRKEGEALRLEVRDNGRGITEEEIARSSSLGLLGMKERALLFGGDIAILGSPRAGTTITVHIPLPKRGEEGYV